MEWTTDQTQQLHRDGFYHLSGWCSAEKAATLYRIIQQLTECTGRRAYNKPEFYTAHKAVNYTFDNPHAFSTELEEIAIGLSACSEKVLPQSIFHMTLIQHNSAGSSHSIPWHQDISADIGPGNFYNFIFYPHDCDHLRGGLRVVPGSHLLGKIPPGESLGHFDGEMTIYPQAGDLIIVDGLAFHAVSTNVSPHDRYSFVTRYISEKAKNSTSIAIGNYRTGSYDYVKQQDVEYA